MPRRSDLPEAQAKTARAVEAIRLATALEDAAHAASVIANRAVEDAWRAGASTQKMASLLSVSRQAIHRRIERAERDRAQGGTDLSGHDRVSIDGLSISDLAKEYGR